MIDLSAFEEAKIDVEVQYLRKALEVGGGNQKEAAKLLGLTYDQLRGLYRKHQERLQQERAE